MLDGKHEYINLDYVQRIEITKGGITNIYFQDGTVLVLQKEDARHFMELFNKDIAWPDEI
jgi:hypothetical protein